MKENESTFLSKWLFIVRVQLNMDKIQNFQSVQPDGAYSHHKALRVKATERILTVCGDDSALRYPLPAYCCIPLQALLAYIKNTMSNIFLRNTTDTYSLLKNKRQYASFLLSLFNCNWFDTRWQ
jgi:hypothetical protein